MNWFIRESRHAGNPEEVFQALCTRLVDIGTPLERVNLTIFLLNPTIHGISFRWNPNDSIESVLHEHGLQEAPGYKLSPVAAMREGRLEQLHQSLENERAFDFEILGDLKAQGFTDYLLLPMHFSDGGIHCLSLATTQAGGFCDVDLQRIEGVLDVVSLSLELAVQRVMTYKLMVTYLGNNAAKLVLAGHIRRGDGDSIQAVVLMCDLRKFTQLSDEHPRQQLLELLDAYFESVVGAIRSSGGEVLKFIGDAVLAVFPLHDEEEGMACHRAAQAAQEAHRATAAVNAMRKKDGELLIDFGIALHFGEVMYGNIGAPDRLDFTVIGPAVNMVSRLEGLCGTLSRSILVSSDFAERYGLKLEDMGEHTLKGIKEPLRVFSLSTS